MHSHTSDCMEVRTIRYSQGTKEIMKTSKKYPSAVKTGSVDDNAWGQ